LTNFGPDLAKKALDLTLNIGTWQCHTFREEIFNRHSVIATDLAREYVRIAEEHDYRAANLTLLNLDSILQRADLNLTEDDHTLKQFAEKRASECRMVKETSPDPPRHSHSVTKSANPTVSPICKNSKALTNLHPC
jgi:hypothetical protein